jgi:hypothetical protein
MRHCLLFLSGLAIACGSGSKNLEPGAGLENRESAARASAAFGQNDLLAYVDADAAYVYASLERLPDGLAERGIRALHNAAEPLYELLDTAAAPALTSPEERMLLAFASAMRDKLSVSGFRSIGIDLEQPFVFYSVGILPVVRLRLQTPAKFTRFVEETAARAGIDVPRRRSGTTEYWAIPLGTSLELAVAVQGQHLVAFLAPSRQPEPTVERALGRPARSLARSDVLPALRKRYDITLNMVGYIDLVRTFAYLRADAEPFELQQRQWLFTDDMHPPSPECMDEFGELVGHVPRVVMGYRALTAGAGHAVTAIETSRALGATLRALVRPHPWLTARPPRQTLFALSMGIDQGVLLRAVSAFSQRSWRCSELQEMAKGLRTAMAQFHTPPVIALVGGITGMHVSVEDLVPDAGGGVSMFGHAFVEHEQPDSLVGLLGLLGLPAVTDRAPPVTMPLPLPTGTQVLSVSRHGGSFVFSVGKGSHERALAARSGPPTDDAPAVTVAYDEARAYQLAEDIPWLYAVLDDRQNNSTRDPDELARLRRVDAALASGFSYAAMWFRDDAIVIESSATGRAVGGAP